MKLHRTPGAKPERPVLLVADSPIDYLKLRALAASLEAAQSPCAPVVVSSRSLRDVRGDEAAADALPAPLLEVCLNAGALEGAEMIAQVLLRFDAQLVDLAPAAVAVIGHDDAVLACALAANRRGIPLLRLDGGLREAPSSSPGGANPALLDRLASVVFTRSVNSHYALYREGIAAERVQCVGSLFGSVLEATRAALPEAADVLRRFGLAPAALDVARPFALLSLTALAGVSLSARLDMLFAQLKGGNPMLWIADRATADAVRTAALESRLERHRVTLLPALGLLDSLALMTRASLVIGDESARLAEEAACLGVPYLELADDGANAEPLARAVDEILSEEQVVREPVADVRAAEAVAQWLSALEPEPARDARAAQEPGRKR
jgi:UDP-N-acetylglucosamine 2-epimerase